MLYALMNVKTNNGLVKVNVNRLEGPRINVGEYGRRCLSPASGRSARGQISECMIEDEDKMHCPCYAMQCTTIDSTSPSSINQ